MTVKTGAAWSGTFVTLSATGAVTAATGTPVGTLYVDGTANVASVTITGANPYKWSVTLPVLTAGQRVDLYITATVSAVATGGIVASEQADTELVSDLSDEVIGTGAGLTALGDTRLANLDAAVSSRGTGAALTAQEVRDAMKLAPTAGSPSAGSVDKHLDDIPTAAQIDTQLSGTHGAGAWGGSGAGGVTWTYTLTEAGTGDPIADADVWLTSDLAGEHVVVSGTTNASGVVTFNVAAATYYVWRRKTGWNFTNPDTEVVT